MTHTLFHRQVSHLLQEKRLCYDALKESSPGASPFERPVTTPRTWPAYLMGYEKPEVYDQQTVRRLDDDQEWVTAIQDLASTTNFLTDPSTVALPPSSTVFGPKEFLQYLPLESRQAVYIDYINRTIPTDIQKRYNWYADKKDEHIAKLQANQGHITNTLLAILGRKKLEELKVEDPVAVEAATAKLSAYYNKTDPAFPLRINNKLEHDYEDTLHYNAGKLQDNPTFASNPDYLKDRINPSFFKGALELGIIDEDILKFMAPVVLRVKKAEHLSATHEVHTNLEALTGSTKEQLRSNAETLSESWNQLPGFVKLATLGAFLYGFVKSKGVRIATVVFGGMLLGQKLLLKQNDPVEGWARMARGIFDPLKTSGRATLPQEYLPGTIENVDTRANMFVKFLKRFDYVDRVTEATSLCLLNDARMRILAKNLRMDGPPGNEFSLDVAGLSPELEHWMEIRGWRNGWKKYLNDPEKNAYAAEAVGCAFYEKAVESLGENNYAVKRLREIHGKMMPGSGIPGLPSAFDVVYNSQTVLNAAEGYATIDEQKEARQLYVDLVGQGRALCMGSDEQLGTFVASIMSKAVAPHTPEAPTPQALFHEKNKTIQELCATDDFRDLKDFTASLDTDPNFVILRLPAPNPAFRTSLQKFNAKTAKEILQAYSDNLGAPAGTDIL